MELLVLILKLLLFASPVTIFLIFLILAIFKPDSYILWASKVTSLFKFLGTGVKKKAVALQVQGAIINASKVICCGNESVTPFDLKIEWVKNKEPESFVSDNRVVVRMSDVKKTDRNMIWVATQYAKYGVIPYAKHHMPIVLNQAIELVVAKILLSSSCSFALPCFYDEIYKIYQKDQRLDRLFHDLIAADNNGILTRIYFNEIAKISDVLRSELQNAVITEELKDFTSFMIDIATRERGDISKLYFNHNYIQVAVMLASSDFSEEVASNNLSRIEKYFEWSYRTVYILALGDKIQTAEHLIEVMKKQSSLLCSVKTSKYKYRYQSGRVRDGICIELNMLTD